MEWWSWRMNKVLNGLKLCVAGMNQTAALLSSMLPYDTLGLYEQTKPSLMYRVPRVVPDQKARFESDELFRRLSRESEVISIWFAFSAPIRFCCCCWKRGFGLVEFDVFVYRWIARKKFYNFVFWWKLIGGSVLLENQEKRDLVVKISLVLVKRSVFKAQKLT